MHQRQPQSQADRTPSGTHLLSRDEAVALFVALACATCCELFLLNLPTPALAEEAGESAQLVEGLAEPIDESAQAASAAAAPANPMALIVVVVIMGTALAIAFIVSRGHGKPQKLGGAKGDVW